MKITDVCDAKKVPAKREMEVPKSGTESAEHEGEMMPTTTITQPANADMPTSPTGANGTHAKESKAMLNMTESAAIRVLERVTNSKPIAAMSAQYKLNASTLAATVVGSMALAKPGTQRANALATLSTVHPPMGDDLAHALSTVRGIARDMLWRTMNRQGMGIATGNDIGDKGDSERAPIVHAIASENIRNGAAIVRWLVCQHGPMVDKRDRWNARKCDTCKAVGTAMLAAMADAHNAGKTVLATEPPKHNASADKVQTLAYEGALASDGRWVQIDKDTARPILTMERQVGATIGAALAGASSSLVDQTGRDALKSTLDKVANKTRAEKPIAEAGNYRTNAAAAKNEKGGYVVQVKEVSLENLLAQGLRESLDFQYEDRTADKLVASAFVRTFLSSDAAPSDRLTPSELRCVNNVAAVFGNFGKGVAWALDTSVEIINKDGVLTDPANQREHSVIRWTELAEACNLPTSSACREALKSAAVKCAEYAYRQSRSLLREPVASLVARDRDHTIATIREAYASAIVHFLTYGVTGRYSNDAYLAQRAEHDDDLSSARNTFRGIEARRFGEIAWAIDSQDIRHAWNGGHAGF